MCSIYLSTFKSSGFFLCIADIGYEPFIKAYPHRLDHLLNSIQPLDGSVRTWMDLLHGVKLKKGEEKLELFFICFFIYYYLQSLSLLGMFFYCMGLIYPLNWRKKRRRKTKLYFICVFLSYYLQMYSLQG